MKRYWYISLTNNYPKEHVISVELKGGHSLIEMTQEAVAEDIKEQVLCYLGKSSSFKGNVRKNYLERIKMIVRNYHGS